MAKKIEEPIDDGSYHQDVDKEIEKKWSKLKTKLNEKYEDQIVSAAESDLLTTRPIPMGVKEIDDSLGIGGFPDNAIIEFFGPEGVGKSFLAQVASVQAQKHDKRMVFYADLEGGLDKARFKSLGIDLNHIEMIQSCGGEELFDKIYEIIESNCASLIVIDSIASVSPTSLSDLPMAEAMKQMGVQARLMSLAFRKLADRVKRHRTAVVCINQLRNKIGATGYGNPEDTPGGRALKFYAQLRGEVKPFYKDPKSRPCKVTDSQGNVIGIHSTVKWIKNKFAQPMQSAVFYIPFGESNPAKDVLLAAKKLKIWFLRNGTCNYNNLADQRISAASEEEFLETLIRTNDILEMATRVLEEQTEGEIVLPEDFDMEEFEAFINKKNSQLDSLDDTKQVNDEIS